MSDGKESVAVSQPPPIDQSRAPAHDAENNKLTSAESGVTHATLTPAQPAHAPLYSSHQQPAHSQPPQSDPSHAYMRSDLALTSHDVDNFFSTLDTRTGQPVVSVPQSGLTGYDEASLATLSNAQTGYAKASHYQSTAAELYKNSNMFAPSATPGLLSNHYSTHRYKDF